MAVVVDVQGGAGVQQGAGLGDDDRNSLVTDLLGSVLECLDRGDLVHAGEGLRLEEVRRDDVGMRQDLLAQGVVGVEGGTRLLALADEDGVEDDLGELVGLQGLGDDADGRRGTEHADLDGVDLAVDGDGGLDLIMNDLRIDRHESGSKETMQVRDVHPNTPSWWKVLRSVWAPAPPEASDPAMASAIFVTSASLGVLHGGVGSCRGVTTTPSEIDGTAHGGVARTRP